MDPLASIRDALRTVRSSIAGLEATEARLARVLEQLELGQMHQGELELDEPIASPAIERPKRGPRYAWTKEEDALLISQWRPGGRGVVIPGRSIYAIRNRAMVLNLSAHAKALRTPPAATPPTRPQPREPQPQESERRTHALPTRKPAPSKPRLTFEEQLALVESGRARVVPVIRIPTKEPIMTLGGVVGPIG